MMKMLRIFLLVGVLSGCATTQVENPWDDLSTETDPAATSLDCGSFPLPSGATETGIEYNKAGTNNLEAYRQCAEANQAIVDLHAAQIGELEISRAALVEAGQSQRNIAQMRQEMLDDERQHHFWQSLGYWVMIIALGAAAL